MKDLSLNGGEIFAIPLFIQYGTDLKRFSKKYHEKENGQYVFCRIISKELGNSYIIEVFSKIGDLTTSLQDILESEKLFRPLAITDLGISKKRWVKLYEDESYNKNIDSNYSDIRFVMGAVPNLQLWQNRITTPITEEESEGYERFIFWRASHLERRIRETLGLDEP